MMRTREPFTEKQKKFIEQNHNRMTYEEIREKLSLGSVYRIVQYMEKNGLKKELVELTDAQKDFVRKNYKAVTLQEMVRRFQLKSVHAIQKFKSEEGLMKAAKSKAKIIDGEFFNVGEKWSWIV